MPPVLNWTRRVATTLLLCAVPAGPGAAPASAATAEGSVVGAGAPDAVPGRYIVTLKPGARSTVAQDLPGVPGTDTFTASLTARDARRLATDPAVQLVEQDRAVRIASTTQNNAQWGLDRIDQHSRTLNSRYTPTDDGSAVTAYVIDTGIHINHHEFAGRASYGYDFVGDDPTAGDCNGHGTHVSGILGGAHYGVAKKVKLVAVRVLDCSGSGSLSDVIAGVNWVTRHAVKPAVANMSLNGDYSPSLEKAVAASIASGVTYAVAAGNEDVDACADSPAGLGAAITVGATDAKDGRAWFSDYGRCLDLFAPGVNIRSSVSTNDTATAAWSGTSMATPFVAGAAALALDAHPGWTPARVRSYLVGGSTKDRVTGKGSGSPNRLLYVPAPPAAPVIATAAVPAATVGEPYEAHLTLRAARRGTWRVADGALPDGLRLSTAGVISGTPTADGAGEATVSFTDWVPTTAKRALTVTVLPPAG
jgi:subtilisin family serine protease